MGLVISLAMCASIWMNGRTDEQKMMVENKKNKNRIVSKFEMTQPIYSSICLFKYNKVDE